MGCTCAKTGDVVDSLTGRLAAARISAPDTLRAVPEAVLTDGVCEFLDTADVLALSTTNRSYARTYAADHDLERLWRFADAYYQAFVVVPTWGHALRTTRVVRDRGCASTLEALDRDQLSLRRAPFRTYDGRLVRSPEKARPTAPVRWDRDIGDWVPAYGEPPA